MDWHFFARHGKNKIKGNFEGRLLVLETTAAQLEAESLTRGPENESKKERETERQIEMHINE
jgi:hypothetical protein